MHISEILKPEAIRLVPNVSSKKSLLSLIGEIASDVYGVPCQDATHALLERESLGPTGVGNGIALPHARLTGLQSVSGVFLRLENPIQFEAVDRQPVDLVFSLLAPKESGVEHLKALALVSRTLRDQGTCGKLRSNMNSATLYTVLTEIAKEAA